MKKNMELVGVFPTDHTIRLYLPERADGPTVQRVRGWLSQWFNGAVAYAAVAGVIVDGDEESWPVTVIESHASDAQITAHERELQHMAADLRRQFGDTEVILQVGPVPPPTPPQVFSTEQAAEYLRVSVATVKKHVHVIGDLHPVKIGPALAFAKEELDRYQAAPRKGPGRPKRG